MITLRPCHDDEEVVAPAEDYLVTSPTGLMTKKADVGEVIGLEPVERLRAGVLAALRRKVGHEGKLAGALRALAPFSATLQLLVAETVDVLSKRGSFDRPLYAGAVRALADVDTKNGVALFNRALGTEDGGGLATLSASCFVEDRALAAALAKVAASRHPHLAFAAEVARLARGEGGGDHIERIAPRIKESLRIALCVELLVPLVNGKALPLAVAPALAVLRDAERHLGRWLVFGEVATRAGDPGPLEEARARAKEGPNSARAAWTLVAWALSNRAAAPAVRPTVELVSRLSDRPSADRDTTFLFRLAEARVPTARAMLENFARGPSLKAESGVRAALYLARDHGREDMAEALKDIAKNPRLDAVRGAAAAALFDLGINERLEGLSEELVRSRHLSSIAWGALVRAGLAGKIERVMTEPAFRRVQLGWVE